MKSTYLNTKEVDSSIKNKKKKTSSAQYESVSTKYCSLSSQDGKYLLPVINVAYQVSINAGLANVNLIIEFKNKKNIDLDVVLLFPLADEVVFSELKAIFQDRLIQGDIRPKDEARFEFSKNKAKGNTVIIAEAKNDDFEDFLTFQLGNLPSLSILQVCITYLARLEIVDDKYWSFKIPASLTPPAYPTTPNTSYSSFLTTASSEISYSNNYDWTIDIDLFWPEKIKKVFSPSHELVLKYTHISKKSKRIQFNPKAGRQYPQDHFYLYVEEENINSNIAFVSKSELSTINGGLPNYAALLQFSPTLFNGYFNENRRKETIDLTKGLDLYSSELKMYYRENSNLEMMIILDLDNLNQKSLKFAKYYLIYLIESLPSSTHINLSMISTREENIRFNGQGL